MRLTVVIDNPSAVPVVIVLPKLEIEAAPEHEDYEFEGLFDAIEHAGGLVEIASTSCNTGPIWGELVELAPGERVVRGAVTDPRATLSWTWTEYAAGTNSARPACSRLQVAVLQGQCWLSTGLEAFCGPQAVGF